MQSSSNTSHNLTGILIEKHPNNTTIRFVNDNQEVTEQISFEREIDGLNDPSQDKHGNTLLIIATLSKANNIALEIVKQTTKPYLDRVDNEGYNALIYALDNSSNEVIKAIINKDANINFVAKNGFSVLNFAINGDNKEIIELLIDKGANLNYQLPILNQNILEFAIAKENIFAIKKITSKESSNDEELQKKYVFVSRKIITRKKLQFLSSWLDQEGVDINAKDEDGNNLLFFSLKQYGKEADREYLQNICKILIDKKIDLETELNEKTALEVAIEEKNLDLAKLFFQNGAKVRESTIKAFKDYKDIDKVSFEFIQEVLKEVLKDKDDQQKSGYLKKYIDDQKRQGLPKNHNIIMAFVLEVKELDKQDTLKQDTLKDALKQVIKHLESKKSLKSFEKGFLKKVMKSGIFSQEEFQKYQKISKFLFSEDLADKGVARDIKIVENMLFVEDERVGEFDGKIMELKRKKLSILEQEKTLTEENEKKKRASEKPSELKNSINVKNIKLENLQKKSKSIKTLLATIDERFQAIKIFQSSNADIVAKDDDGFKIDKASFESYLKDFTVTKFKDSSVVFNCTSAGISEDEKKKINGVLSKFYELESVKTGFNEEKFFKNPNFTRKLKSFMQEQYKPQIKTSKEEELNLQFQKLSALIDSKNDIIHDRVKQDDEPKVIDTASEEVQTNQTTIGEDLTSKPTTGEDLTRQKKEAKLGGVEIQALQMASASNQAPNDITTDPVELTDEIHEDPATTPASSVKINYTSSEIANLRKLFGIETSGEQLRLHNKGNTYSKYEDFLVNLSSQNLVTSTDLQGKKIGELKTIFHQKLDQELINSILPEGSNSADERKLRSYLYGVIAYNIGGEEGDGQFVRNYLELQRTSFEHGEFTGFAHASGANKENLLKMIAVVDKLLEVKNNYQEEVEQIKTLEGEGYEEKILPPHPLRIDNFHRQLLLKIPELNRPEKGDEEYLNDLLNYYRDYDQIGSYHSSSEKLIKEKFDELKQEFKDLTSLALDYVVVQRDDKSAIMAHEFSKIFGFENAEDFKNLQEKFKKSDEELFKDEKIKDYFLNFLKEENFIELSPLQGAKTKSKFIKFKEFSQEKFEKIEGEYRKIEADKSAGMGVGGMLSGR